MFLFRVAVRGRKGFVKVIGLYQNLKPSTLQKPKYRTSTSRSEADPLTRGLANCRFLGGSGGTGLVDIGP